MKARGAVLLLLFCIRVQYIYAPPFPTYAVSSHVHITTLCVILNTYLTHQTKRERFRIFPLRSKPSPYSPYYALCFFSALRSMGEITDASTIFTASPIRNGTTQAIRAAARV